jgi:AraC-like DNA-binding protein
MTPRQYIIRCRLRHAMKLLAKEQLALADIALEVGCACQSHLTTLFRKHLGTTPGAFRDSATGRSERVLRFTPATLRKDQSASDDTWPASQWAGRGIEDARHSEAAG